MILCIGTTPAAQRVMMFHNVRLDEVNRAVTTLDGAAGKAVNVAKVLQALGASPVVTGFLGGARGQQLQAQLEARGIPLEFVTVATPTRQCITVIDQATGTVTELVEESQPVNPEHYDELMIRIEKRMPECRAAVMSGTIASGGPVDLYLRCTRLAREARALSVVDAAGPALWEALDARPGLVKPNRSELAMTLGREVTTDEDVLGGMRELHDRGAERVVITSGAAPAFASDGKRAWRIRGPAVKALNPIGSGDAFTAALTWRLLEGDDLGEACRWASAAGAANALTSMAGDVNPEEVARLVREASAERITRS